MNQDKLYLINKLFEGKEVRTVWDKENEKYYISVVDMVGALSESNRPRKYWSDLKKQLTEEGNELSGKIGQLKMKSSDGKYYMTDVCDIEEMFRIIESVPSKKAEPVKLWLARLGKDRIDETFDPSLTIQRAFDNYRAKGYDEEWSGMTAKGYKEFKGLRKESLRDNMSDIEVALSDHGELATRELVKKHKPYGIYANKKIARAGGSVAACAGNSFEEKLGESVITNSNNLEINYLKENLIENK